MQEWNCVKTKLDRLLLTFMRGFRGIKKSVNSA